MAVLTGSHPRSVRSTPYMQIIGVTPNTNVLLGAAAIKGYLRIRSWATLYRLVELYGLPAIKRPDGKWMSTITAIDEWLFLASAADFANRPYLRGTNVRLEEAISRLQRRVADASASPKHTRPAERG